MKAARSLFLLCACAWSLSPTRALAYATFEINVTDLLGRGFNDPTPADPIAGNTETTVGAQRRAALQRAAELWGTVLDSEMPIRVDAFFEPLGCGGGATIAALGGGNYLATGIEGDGGDPSLWYGSALADRLMGDDQYPGEADIIISFNSDYDQPGCSQAWYLGFDSDPGELVDFITVALHELGHGLGVGGGTDVTTGALLFGAATPFDVHVFDLDQDLHWDEMDDAGRMLSATNVRGVVWDGPHLHAAAAEYLEAGSPLLTTTPDLGLSGEIADAEFGARPVAMSVSAPLQLGDPLDGCMPFAPIAGAVVLLRAECRFSSVAANLEAAGAVGALMAIDSTDTRPARALDEEGDSDPSDIPVLSITHADALLLEAALVAGAVTVEISGAPDQLIGADADGRPFMNVIAPVTASSVGHLDTLLRPSALMEPTVQTKLVHGVDITSALLRDLGWEPFCGNERLDQEEECDDGADNDDTEPDACRETCVDAACGDSVVDSGEACDEGDDNSDTAANSCRSDCQVAHCGDGVVDDTEECDEGEDNTDGAGGACRTDCSEPFCGDGVMDTGEECDEGAANSETAPDACRVSCSAPSCGDGTIDTDEACDDGPNNSDTAPDACRGDCAAPSCGDAVLDTDEACDEGAANSDTLPDACRASCVAAACGDGVIDEGEQCDGAAECGEECVLPGFVRDPDGGIVTQSPKAKDSGCGCRAIGSPRSSPRAAYLVVMLLAAMTTRYSRGRARRRATRGLAGAL